MGSSEETLSKISKLTREIETNYPGLYKYLDESPMTIPNEAHPNIDAASMDEYLETLERLLSDYKGERE
ncbi:hypothetical protein [Snuella sedimenti]|uniref:Uncharacterized protein n=1 Tax=Snuella sedimenti TaxID=2798802 RepID=A0A8J7IWM4_9FLAO|nr:hypothetical protein [Snuella sedimenti]MBJ6368455.1 hypothetical protein [Snuella sedimenti]